MLYSLKVAKCKHRIQRHQHIGLYNISEHRM